MASTCLQCQAQGDTHTFEDPADYAEHLRTEHGPGKEKRAEPTSPRQSPRLRSPRQPRQPNPKRKK